MQVLRSGMLLQVVLSLFYICSFGYYLSAPSIKLLAVISSYLGFLISYLLRVISNLVLLKEGCTKIYEAFGWLIIIRILNSLCSLCLDDTTTFKILDSALVRLVLNLDWAIMLWGSIPNFFKGINILSQNWKKEE